MKAIVPLLPLFIVVTISFALGWWAKGRRMRKRLKESTYLQGGPHPHLKSPS
jgi:hypothetical protein